MALGVIKVSNPFFYFYVCESNGLPGGQPSNSSLFDVLLHRVIKCVWLIVLTRSLLVWCTPRAVFDFTASAFFLKSKWFYIRQ